MEEMIERAQTAMTVARGICKCDNMLQCKADGSPLWSDDEIEKIVVAAALREAVADERAACAEIARDGTRWDGTVDCEEIAQAIEARGKGE